MLGWPKIIYIENLHLNEDLRWTIAAEIGHFLFYRLAKIGIYSTEVGEEIHEVYDNLAQVYIRGYDVLRDFGIFEEIVERAEQVGKDDYYDLIDIMVKTKEPVVVDVGDDNIRGAYPGHVLGAVLMKRMIDKERPQAK